MRQIEQPESRIHRFYTIREVMVITTLSRATIYRKMATGTFPACISISEGRVAWVDRDIEEWCESRVPKNAE
jgi:prophage regulatory protein